MSKVDAIKFVAKCRNWSEVALPIAAHKVPGQIVLKNGLRFESSAILWADVYAIFFLQVYTPPYLPIEKDDIVVDIGANIGVFTVYAASITHNEVYAFEPSPDNFEAIKQNVQANRLNNVIPYRLAVSDSCSKELLLDAEFSQQHRLQKIAPGKIGTYLEVSTATLQEIMDSNHLEQIDFLKMDCEGSEGLILQSTSKGHLQRIRKIALEFHDTISKLNHNDIRKLLEEAGFTTAMNWDGKSHLGILHAWRT